MRPLMAAGVLAATMASCGGRSLEIIRGYNEGGSHAGAGGTAGRSASLGGSAGRTMLAGSGPSSAGAAAGTATGGAGGFSGAAGAGGSGAAGGVGPGGSDGAAGSAAGSAGRACEGALTNDQFDPNRVYLAGTLSPGSCGAPALVTPECPNSAAVGFDCDFDGNSEPQQTSAQIRPTDGRLLYGTTFDPEIREFHCDGCPYLEANANDYPDDGLANDPIIAAPCGANFGPSRFFVSPEGPLYFRCPDGSWQDESGRSVYAVPDFTLAHVGYNGLALTHGSDALYSLEGASVVNLTSGESTPVTGLPDANVFALRAAPPDRFLVFLVIDVELPDDDRSELWEIDRSGRVTRRGEYPPFPTEVGPAPGAKLLPNGVLYQMATGPRVVEDVIVRREIGGETKVVYTEADDPHVKIHISGLVTGP